VFAFATLAMLAAGCRGGASHGSTGTSTAGHAPCSSCAESGAGAASAAGSGSTASLGGGAASSGAADNLGGASGAAGDQDDTSPADTGVGIAEVSFWQAMRVPLELSGAPVPPNAPIVTNKEGIFRIYVTPGAHFSARQLTAELQFGVAPNSLSLTSTKQILAASVDGQFATTFNFPIDAENVTSDAAYSVVLLDGPAGPELDRYPATGQSALAAVSAGKTLNVVVVPIVVAGVTPNVSADTLATFRARVLSMYPLADFTLTTHEPLVSDVVVGPDTGWDKTLDALYALRARDAPADNVYYYGMFTPAKRFEDYCVADCTVGLSEIADPDEIEYRGSVGLGIFSDGSNRDAPDTMAHELGHALGRDHAPCMTSDPGPFPYGGGKIGVWGFDSLNHLLLDPTLYGDVMGYCSPDWISDFTYDAIFTRIQYVNASVTSAKALRFGMARPVFRRVLVDAHGTLSWGSSFTPVHAVRGTPRDVLLFDAGGASLAAITGYFQPFGDTAAGFLLVPAVALDPRAGVSSIRVASAELSLGAAMP